MTKRTAIDARLSLLLDTETYVKSDYVAFYQLLLRVQDWDKTMNSSRFLCYSVRSVRSDC